MQSVLRSSLGIGKLMFPLDFDLLICILDHP